MDFWTAVVAIAAIAIPFEFVKFVIKQKHKKSEAQSADLSESKLESLQHRIESLETLVLELERDRKFRDLK